MYSVEEKILSEEIEKISFDAFGNVGLEVEEVKIRLIVDRPPFGSGNLVKLSDNVGGQMRDWAGVGPVIGEVGAGWVDLAGLGFDG